MARTFTPPVLGPGVIATSDLRQHNKHLVGTMLCVVRCAGTVVWMVRVFRK